MKFDGQARAAQFLSTAWSTGRLAHAFAFIGPRGIGKRVAALEFAAALITDNVRLDAETDPVVRRRVLNGAHPDVRVYAPEAGKRIFGKPVMEEVLKDLALRPNEGSHRVAILDQAHYLNAEAANTFLKTLEEPPPRVQIILLVDEWFALLETIRSRVQPLRFTPMPADSVVESIDGETTEEGVDAALLQALAPLAQGSPGVLRELLGDDFAATRAFLLESVMRTPMPDPVDASDALIDSVKKAADTTQEPQRRRLRVALEQVAIWWRDLLVASKLDAGDAIDPAVESNTRRMAERFPVRQLVDHIDRLMAMTDDLAMNTNVKMWSTRFLDLAPFPDRAG